MASVKTKSKRKVDPQQAEEFYESALQDLHRTGVPHMIGGAYAMREYAGLFRDTKDLDVFCKASDYPRILACLAESGYRTEVTDANWIAKAFCGSFLIDAIFNSHNGLCSVDDTWFEHARPANLFGIDVLLIPAEEEIWTKLYVQDRYRYDGADVNHIIRKSGGQLDWKRLMRRMEVHWQLLLSALINFRFVYPSDRDQVPAWVMHELLERMRQDEDMPVSKDPICRGPFLSRSQYEPDVAEWGYRRM